MAKKSNTKTDVAIKKNVAYLFQERRRKVLSSGYNATTKLLFLRIESFGEAGCSMTNEALGEEFNSSNSTIQRAVSSLFSKGDVIITGRNGFRRKIYATGHPGVAETLNKQCLDAKSRGKV